MEKLCYLRFLLLKKSDGLGGEHKIVSHSADNENSENLRQEFLQEFFRCFIFLLHVRMP
jgi:hypothetical protein